MKYRKQVFFICSVLSCLSFSKEAIAQFPILRSSTAATVTTAGASASLLTQNGNFVGIGTATPTEKLTLKYNQESLSSGGMTYITNRAPAIRFDFESINGDVRAWRLFGGDGFELNYLTGNISPIKVNTSGDVNFMSKIQANMNVFIPGSNGLGLEVSDQTTRKIYWTAFTHSPATNNTNVGLDFVFDMQGAGTTDVTIMSLKPTGKVGIGTTAPSEKFEVSGGNAKVNNGNLMVNSGNVTIYNGRLIIESPTGLGTGTKRIALNPDGTIRAREILVDLVTIPDYVFADKYPLMPMGELRNYIQKNKHLPGIQSESEYQEQGHINVGELNVKLLEKVEELTLYILQLEEKMEKMNTKIEAINAQQK